MSQSSSKPPSALSPPQPHGAPLQRQRMTGARLAAAVTAWITLSLLAGGATMLLRSMLAPGLTANTLAVIIVTEVYVLLVVVLLAAVGGWSAAVAAYGLRSRPRDVLVGVLGVGALSVATLLGYAVIGAWAPLAEELVWVGRDGGRLGSLDPGTTEPVRSLSHPSPRP